MVGRLVRSLFVFAALIVPAAAQDVGTALRSQRWSEAAGRAGDALGMKLVDWVRMQAPGQASAAEIGAFIGATPDWPWRGLLEQRRQEALARETSDAVLAVECGRTRLDHLPALIRCADWAAR